MTFQFFSTYEEEPFSSIEEGINLYPEWKMFVISGEEALVSLPAAAGNKLFQFYWDLTQTEGYKISHSIDEILNQLMIPGQFLYGSEIMVFNKAANSRLAGYQFLNT